MKKIVLAGELNEIMRSLNECLVEDFQVQLCTEQFDNVKGMLKIIKPELLIINQVGAQKLENKMFDWLQQKYPNLPVLVIAVREEWDKYSEHCMGGQFRVMFRPVSKYELQEKCYELLKMKSGNEEKKTEKKWTRKQLLLVDDSALMLRSMKTILEEDYKVFLATSGEQALKMLEQRQPDLILLDYDMPGMDGKRTFELLKENEKTKDIPVVFLTAVAEREQIYAVLPSRPSGYILKPPDRTKLVNTIEDVLRGK